jgi:hypothetical protein
MGGAVKPIALSGILLGIVPLFACSTTTTSTPTLFTSPQAILETWGDLSVSEVVLFEPAKGEIAVISSEGEILYRLPVTPPAGGFPGGRYGGIWLNEEKGAFFAVAGTAPLLLPILRRESGLLTPGEWVELNPGTLHLWEGELLSIPRGAKDFTRGTTTYTLPPPPAVLPFSLSPSGFVFLEPPSTLAFWEPLSGVNRFSYTAKKPIGSFFADPPWVLFQSEGALWLLGIGETGFRELGSIPWEIPILRAWAGSTTLPTFWIATLNEGLLLLMYDPEKRSLCLSKVSYGGALFGNLQFYDSGPLSNPSLTVIAVDDEGCPGKTPTDLWTLTFMQPPPFWVGITLGPGINRSDLPWGEALEPGDLFLPYSEPSSYAVSATDPLTFSPPLTATLTGILLPRERFLLHRRNGGYLGFLPLDEERRFGGLSLLVHRGEDPPTPLDRFTFITRAGYLGIGGRVEVKGVARLDEDRATVLGGDGTLTLFSPKTGEILKTLR